MIVLQFVNLCRSSFSILLSLLFPYMLYKGCHLEFEKKPDELPKEKITKKGTASCREI